MRIAFAGSPAAAVPALVALAASPDHQVVAVVTQPDRPRGRRGDPLPTPVAEAAGARGLPVLRPPAINAPEVIAELEGAGVEALAVVAFGQILREGILSRWPCVNVHFSLLPAYRGAAPVERAMMDGAAETGVTIMLMDAGLDTGPMLMDLREPIADEDTGGDLIARLAEIGAALLPRALSGLADGSIVPRPQPEEGISLAPKIGPEDRAVDRSRTARQVARQIQALSPHIGATARIGGEPFKLWRARVVYEPRPDGLAADDGRLLLGCADGTVEILELQPPGRSRMTAADFLRGRRTGLDWGPGRG
jgi:methionyl-tRNA formyltransferase